MGTEETGAAGHHRERAPRGRGFFCFHNESKVGASLRSKPTTRALDGLPAAGRPRHESTATGAANEKARGGKNPDARAKKDLATTYSRGSYTATTIGNAAFDFRVRDGIGSGHSFIVTKKTL